MTPQDRRQTIREIESDFEAIPASGDLTLLSDDEPFELPQCNAEEAIALLKSWYNPAEAEDQRETLEFLMRHLDEDRFTERKLFP